MTLAVEADSAWDCHAAKSMPWGNRGDSGVVSSLRGLSTSEGAADDVTRRKRVWLVVVLKAFLGIAAAALIVFEVLLQLNIYHDPTWVPVAVAVVVAVGSFITNSWGTVRAATEARREGVRQRIQKSCIAAAALTSQITGLDMLTIGVSVFKTRRRPAARWSSRPFYLQVHHLERVERFRLNDTPQPSTVRWLAGKGAIGKCVETRRWVHKNWSPVVQRFQDEAPTQAEFSQLPEGVRDGFDYDEFIGIMDKYAEILALPVMSVGGGEIVGVIAIDRPFDADRVAPALKNLKVRDAVEMTIAAINVDVASAPILDR
jgi:hypothetical protein